LSAASKLRAKVAAAGLVGLSLLSLVGCDTGSPDNQPTVTGPPINLVTSGTNISGGTYTIDQPIILQFDRFLNPVTVTRQSLVLTDLNGNAVDYPPPSYDPVTLTVSIHPPPGQPWLNAGTMYEVTLPVASSDGGYPYGLLAIDGATLTPTPPIEFMANPAASPPYAGPPTMGFCNDVFSPIFQNTCSYGTCHIAANPSIPDVDAGHPPLGLDLSSAAGVRATAINQVADESNTGPAAQPASNNQSVPFGIDMEIIQAGSPGLSWMVYKTLLAVPEAASDETVGGDSGISAYGQNITPAISAAERARLSNFILGQSMPYPNPSTMEPSTSFLTEGDMERLSIWIAQGAQTPTSCP
jgi:hypothetical protein